MTFGLVHATIKDTQLGSHCFDTCLGFLPMLYCKGFLVGLLSSRPLLRAKGKRGRAQHVRLFIQLTQVLMSRIVATACLNGKS